MKGQEGTGLRALRRSRSLTQPASGAYACPDEEMGGAAGPWEAILAAGPTLPLDLDQLLPAGAAQMARLAEVAYCRLALLDEASQTLTVQGAAAPHLPGWDLGIGSRYALSLAPGHRLVVEKCRPLLLGPGDIASTLSPLERRAALTRDAHRG